MRARIRSIEVVTVALLTTLLGLVAAFRATVILTQGAHPAVVLDVLYGVALLFVAWGLFTLRRWAWTPAVVVHGLDALLAVVALASAPSLLGAWVMLAVSAGCVFLLTRPHVRAMFGRATAAPDRSSDEPR